MKWQAAPGSGCTLERTTYTLYWIVIGFSANEEGLGGSEATDRGQISRSHSHVNGFFKILFCLKFVSKILTVEQLIPKN